VTRRKSSGHGTPAEFKFEGIASFDLRLGTMGAVPLADDRIRRDSADPRETGVVSGAEGAIRSVPRALNADVPATGHATRDAAPGSSSRVRKNGREKRRRAAMNDRYDELMMLLNPGIAMEDLPLGTWRQPGSGKNTKEQDKARQKMNKAEVLVKAAETILSLRQEIVEMRARVARRGRR
jgi:hypothetical protein